MVLLLNPFFESFREFLFQTTWLEWAGVISGTLCVWLAAKNIIWNWPAAIISVLIYIFIFFESKLYADMGLQVYFLAMNIYGWYFWSRKKENSDDTTPVTQISKGEILWGIAGVVLFTGIIGYLLHNHTDASFPFIDSFCTACSVVAQVFLARKVLQNWLIWIFVDAIYVAVYFSKGLYATGCMYALYIYIAAMGYYAWKKSYEQQRN